MLAERAIRRLPIRHASKNHSVLKSKELLCVIKADIGHNLTGLFEVAGILAIFDEVADIFTESRGRVSFLLPVTHSKRSKVRSVLFQPLSILHFQAQYAKTAAHNVQQPGS